jgi:hypothetical protein
MGKLAQDIKRFYPKSLTPNCDFVELHTMGIIALVSGLILECIIKNQTI